MTGSVPRPGPTTKHVDLGSHSTMGLTATSAASRIDVCEVSALPASCNVPTW
jgi:hypothetical protein